MFASDFVGGDVQVGGDFVQLEPLEMSQADDLLGELGQRRDASVKNRFPFSRNHILNRWTIGSAAFVPGAGQQFCLFGFAMVQKAVVQDPNYPCGKLRRTLASK